MTALSRATDPQTSHEAAAIVNATGSATTQRNACLVYLEEHCNEEYTAAEIAVALSQDRHTPSRRLPELRRSGLVMNGQTRVCRVQGRSSMTWLIKGRGE